MSHSFRLEREFDWRALSGAGRWPIVGSLCLALCACGGRADSTDLDREGGAASNGGSAAGVDGASSVGTSAGARAGTGGVGAALGSGGSAGFSGSAGKAGSSGTGSSGAPTRPSPCNQPGLAPQGELQVCANGMIHRPASNQCSEASGIAPAPDAGPQPIECLESGDCYELPDGRCILRQCVYGIACTTDANCSARHICLCDGGEGHCVPSNCSTDSECGAGLFCAVTTMCGESRFTCQSRQDECAVDRDCPSGSQCMARLVDNPSQPIPEPTDYVRECVFNACGPG